MEAGRDEAVLDRGLDLGVPEGADGVPPLVVGEDEEDVRFCR